MSKARIIHELHDDFGVTISEAEKAYGIAIEYIRLRSAIGDHPEDYEPSEYVLVKASAQPEIAKEYNLKKIYNIYVKIAQAHFVYQPSKPKTITAMPFDWIEVQNLLEKYLEDHGADFDALRREYVSENVKGEEDDQQ